MFSVLLHVAQRLTVKVRWGVHANSFAKQVASAIHALRSLDVAHEFAMFQVNDQMNSRKLFDGCNVMFRHLMGPLSCAELN